MLYNLKRCYTATIGTGTLTIGAAILNDFSDIPDGTTVSYSIMQGSLSAGFDAEVGRGTYSAGTLARDTVLSSTSGGAKIALDGTAQVVVTALAEDFVSFSGGVAGQVAAWSGTDAITAGALIPPASNILTLTNAAASTLALNITAAKTLTLTAADNYTLTVPESLTVAGRNVANTFTVAQKITTSSNNIAALQVENASGTDVFSVDTLYTSVGIGGVEGTTERLEVSGNMLIADRSSLSTEMVTNGDFATNTVWSYQAGWAYDATNLRALHTAGSTNLVFQNLTFNTPNNINLAYLITFDIVASTTGTVRPQLGGVTGQYLSGNKTHTMVIIPTSTNALAFLPSSDFDGAIDNVSVKRITSGNLRISGNIGIGPGLAAAPLDITRGVTAVTEYIRLTNSNNSATGNGSINWHNPNGAINHARIWSEPGASYTASILYIDVANASKTITNRARINQLGYMSIGDSLSPSTRLHVQDSVATTNAVIETVRIEAVSSGTVAAGFGSGLSHYAETATNGTNQLQALIASSWVDATNATRKAKLALSAYDTSARIGIEIEASGTAAKLGFFGGTTAVQQVLAAYTSDGEGAAYTGIDNLQVGTVYATVVDLNQLRVAYETLRASYDDLRTKLQTSTLVA